MKLIAILNQGQRIVPRLGLVLLLSCISLASQAVPQWDGTLGQEDGLPLVNNPAHPISGDQTITPQKVWHLGGEDDDQETVFGLIGDAQVDAEGNTYLLDVVLSTIYKIGPDGSNMATLGHEGDGPGEFRNSRSMTIMPGGDLGIMEMMSGKIVVLGIDGEPRSSFAFGGDANLGMQHLQRIAAHEQGVVIGQVSTSFDEGSVTTTYALGSYAPDGTARKILFEDKQVQSGGAISLSMGSGGDGFTANWALYPDGRVVVFQKGQEYKLEMFAPDGEPGMIIRRDYEPVRRPDQDIKRDQKRREEMRQRFGGDVDLPVPEIARHISGAIPRPNGELWVQNSQGDRDCPAQSIGYFDVIDRDGHYVKRVCIKADYDSERDNYSIRGNHLFVFKEAQKAPARSATSGGGGMMMVMVGGGVDDEEEDEDPRPYEVICYRLP